MKGLSYYARFKIQFLTIVLIQGNKIFKIYLAK